MLTVITFYFFLSIKVNKCTGGWNNINEPYSKLLKI